MTIIHSAGMVHFWIIFHRWTLDDSKQEFQFYAQRLLNLQNLCCPHWWSSSYLAHQNVAASPPQGHLLILMTFWVWVHRLMMHLHSAPKKILTIIKTILRVMLFWFTLFSLYFLELSSSTQAPLLLFSSKIYCFLLDFCSHCYFFIQIVWILQWVEICFWLYLWPKGIA